MIDFSKKINTKRNNSQSKNLLGAFESDRGRIINSAAIRRLQQKTQVFPLERNAAVRSRLTHSLEVQQVGRHIVRQIQYLLTSSTLAKEIDGDTNEWFRAIESLVEMACLSHDIGNPPFGHFGEKSISDWFNKHLPNIFESALQSEDIEFGKMLIKDLEQFEGNAQAIRVVTSLLNLNLSYTQIAGLIKYTRPAYLNKSDIPNGMSYLMRKPGFYLSESNVVGDVYRALDMEIYHRHFVSYIMEAADDISYCFADIEDAVEKNILKVEDLLELLPRAYTELGLDAEAKSLYYFGKEISFRDLLDAAKKEYDDEPVDKDHHFFIALRVNLQHVLVSHAARRFCDNFDEVFAGSFNEALLEDQSAAHHLAEAFKIVAFWSIPKLVVQGV